MFYPSSSARWPEPLLLPHKAPAEVSPREMHNQGAGKILCACFMSNHCIGPDAARAAPAEPGVHKHNQGRGTMAVSAHQPWLQQHSPEIIHGWAGSINTPGEQRVSQQKLLVLEQTWNSSFDEHSQAQAIRAQLGSPE